VSVTAGGCPQGATSLLEWSDQRAGVHWQRATRGQLSTEDFQGSDNEI